MNLTILCFVLVALSAPAFSKSVNDKSVTQNHEEKLPEEKITTLRSIDENSTSEADDDDDDDNRGFGNVIENLFASGNNEMQASGEGRTFALKRLQFMMMPMIYKMGVIMTLLMVLTVISLKGLAIGVILLVLKLGAIFGKFYASTQSHGPAYGQWSPPQAPQPVHVHVHNSGGGQHHHPQAYSGWESSGPSADEHYYYKG